MLERADLVHARGLMSLDSGTVLTFRQTSEEFRGRIRPPLSGSPGSVLSTEKATQN